MELLALHPEADVLEYPVCVYHGTAKAYRYMPGACEITDYTGWARRKGYIHSYAWNKIINARCGSLSAFRKANGMKMSSPSRPYCAKHDASCVRTKGYIIIAVAKVLSPTPSVTRVSTTFFRPTSCYITLCRTTLT